MISIVAIILTYNEAAHIVACIDSVREWVDWVLVFDSFSTDATVRLAQSAGADVIQHPFEHYAAQRNAALEAVRGTAGAVYATDWVLFVDADERITLPLADEIRRAVEDTRFVGYKIPRDNYIFGKLTRGAGWYPDYQTRLLKVNAARYDANVKVHEVVILDGTEGTLNHSITHYNYATVAQFHAKQRRYTAYDAQILYESGVIAKPHNFILQPIRQFWWRFVTLRGYRDGLHGLRLSLFMGWYEFKKYLTLSEMQGERFDAKTQRKDKIKKGKGK